MRTLDDNNIIYLETVNRDKLIGRLDSVFDVCGEIYYITNIISTDGLDPGQYLNLEFGSRSRPILTHVNIYEQKDFGAHIVNFIELLTGFEERHKRRTKMIQVENKLLYLLDRKGLLK